MAHTESPRSSLQPKHCSLTSLVVKTRLGAETKESVASPGVVGIEVRVGEHKEEPTTWIGLNINVIWTDEPESCFERLEIGLSAIFAHPDGGVDQTLLKEQIVLLCLTNTLGIARGILLQVTGTCHGGPYCLPLLDVRELLEEVAPKPEPKRPSKKRSKSTKSKTKG